MNQIIDSFRSCQAEQGRVIDAVYGAMSGRDKSGCSCVRGQVYYVVMLSVPNIGS